MLTGMTVDAQGNIYADAQNSSSVVKVTAAGVASELSFPGITPAINDSQGVAVDAMGNIYVVDSANQRIVRLTTAGVASALGISGLPAPSGLSSILFGVTLDPFGNLYIPDASNNRIVFVNVSASVLAFPSTDVGLTSSPQTTTVANLGDLPLVFATVPTYTANFSEDTGDGNLCALGTSLAAGTLCDVAIEFTPQSAGSLNTGIVVTNNSLNLTATTQNVAVSGTGIAVADTTAVAVSTNPTAANIGQPITVTATVTDTTAGHTATIPTGGVTFMDSVGSTSVSLNGGSAVTLSGIGKAVLAGVTLSGAGVHTITAHYPGVSGSFAASSGTTTLTVSKDTATIAGPVTQPVQVVNGQASSVPVTVTGPYSVSVVAAPTGSLSYNILNSSNASVASATATLTAGSTDSAASIPLASSLLSGSYTVNLTYAGDGNFAPSTSTPAIIGVGIAGGATTSADFAVAATGNTTQTILPGTSASFAFSIQPIGSTPLSSPIALAATGLPNLATASFNPTYLPPGATSNTVTLTITTPKATTLNHTSAPQTTAFALLLLPIAAITVRLRNPHIRFLTISLLTLPLTLCLGCGARINTGIQSNSANPAQSYTITVTGTATTSTGTILQHAATVTLVVQPSN